MISVFLDSFSKYTRSDPQDGQCPALSTAAVGSNAVRSSRIAGKMAWRTAST
jgi:hypothetical protein